MKLRKAGFLSIRERRIKDQLVCLFKMKNKMIDLDFEEFFQRNNYKKTRGNAFKLLIPKSKTKIRHHFFSCSVIKHWNRMKATEIYVRNVHIFKKNILRYLAREKIW